MDYFDNPQDVVEFVCEGCQTQFGDVPVDHWTCDGCGEEFCGGRRLACQPVGGAVKAEALAAPKLCEQCVSTEHPPPT